VHQDHPSRTAGIVVKQSQIADLAGILPDGLTESSDFRKDMNLGGAYWFYNGDGKRVLLVQKKETPEKEASF